MRNIDLFPEAIIELQKEIQLHPKLLTFLQTNSHAGYAYLFGVVGEYCGIMLDGIYTYEDIIKLSDVMTVKLREIRTVHVSSAVVVDKKQNVAILLPPGYHKNMH